MIGCYFKINIRICRVFKTDKQPMISKQKPFGTSFLTPLFYYLHLTAITNFLGLTDSWMMHWPFAIVFPRMEVMGVGCDDIAARH